MTFYGKQLEHSHARTQENGPDESRQDQQL